MRSLLTLALCAGLTASAESAQPAGATAAALHFSAKPTDTEIVNARIFDEPLLAIGAGASPAENKALADALASYAGRANLDDFSALTAFLSLHPESPWSASLLLHLGTEYYNFGYYSKALNAWEQAWLQFKNVNDPKGNAQAGRALGELVRLDSKLGRMPELEHLLDSTATWALTGPATQLLANGKDALWMMQHHPEICFRCGPMALGRILAQHDPAKATSPLIVQSASTTNGFSLAQVAELSERLGMNYQIAFRSAGAPLIAPAVLHWRENHYAALLAQKGQRWLVQDPTFHSSLWMTTAAINEESSGYFLVPSGTLPKGWRAVPEGEASTVFGKGFVGGPGPGGPNGSWHFFAPPPPPPPPPPPDDPPDSCPVDGGMTIYSLNIAYVSLTLRDTPVGYTPPVGPPVKFTATYNQAEPNQPATFSYSNLGQKWTCNWISYITDNPNSPGGDVSLFETAGGTLYFTGFNSTTKSYAPELETQALLTMTSPSSYTLTLSNGASQVFSMSDGSAGASRRIFLTQVLDPAGNSVQLNYDGQLRITNIVDAIGQATTLLYTNTAYPDAITSVEDPFGRTAYLQYTSAGLLSQITDVLGITSQYTYETNDFVSALQTPYGISTFFTGQTNGTTWLTATDPLGGTELLEFNQTYEPSSDSPVTVPRGMGALDTYLNFRNSFYWDKVAYQQGAGDFTKAVIYHFCHDAANQSLESDIPESIKKPLENRVWFNYPGQTLSIVNGTISRPSAIGRVLDDGTSPVTYYQYNSLGNVTNMIDPVGRNFSYIYSTNNVDLLQTVMTHNGKYEIQKTVTYNSQHLPLTITDAAGQTTNFTYNASGQILAITDPKGETTSFSYDPNGYVLTMTGPLQTTNDVASFTHDGYGRLQTMTDTEGYTVTFNYDAADRVTQTTHPDGTSEQFVYSNLDRVASCDRLGRWTTNTYNALQQLTRTQDPLGRVTQLEWCRCGAITALTDPLGHTTTWEYDVESRPIAKHFADGSTVSWVYENTTSRLAATWDEKGQQKAFRYYPDNNLLQVSYPNAIVTTPTVTFTYDPDYNRIITMQDGIGTSTYAYIPITTTPALGAGLLASVTGPLPNSTVTYQYDQLGRVVKQAINGVTQTTAYDSLGRPTKVGNALGAFQYSYVDATPRLASATYPNGQTSLYAYYNTLGDERLQQIQNLYPNGSPLSSFGYAYNAVGQITAWTNLWDTVPMRVWQPAYDAVDELTNVASTGGVSPITSYTYAYDPAANRLLAATNGGQMTSSYNILNQFISSSIPSNNVTYEWDGENRLTAINQGSNREEFSYDGMSRRVGVTEMANGVTISNFFYLWCETNICEVRDSTGANVTKRLFDQGEQAVGTGAQPAAASYYYTRDHLGSVRESVDATGTLASRFDYDPYGQQTVLQQNFKPEFGYAGYVADSASGLYFTRHRALDSSLGRWLSRDPHHGAELLPEGPNLYAYVGNSPITRMDPTGLDCPNHRDWWNWKGQFDDYMAWVMQQLTDALTKANNATQIKGG